MWFRLLTRVLDCLSVLNASAHTRVAFFSVSRTQTRLRFVFRLRSAYFAALLLPFALTTTALAQDEITEQRSVAGHELPHFSVDGVVRDRNGNAVAGASVTLTSKSFKSELTTTTDAKGAFAFDDIEGASGGVLVHSNGFADFHGTWEVCPSTSEHLEITLEIASQREQVVVTATRIPERLGDVAGGSVALTREDLDSGPALAVDDKLKQIPGFQLFRRTGSRWANPTAQGVSLSGLGGSGASRALVLQDGVPLNDPFGGWIQWPAIPDQGLSRVEVVPRGASSLYGGDALGGVIQFFTRQPEEPSLAVDITYGSQNTPDLSLWTGTRAGKWDLAFSADLYHTDGYVLVPPPSRGTVDTPANSEDAAVSFTVGRQLGDRTRIFARGSYFTEDRDNGTPIQTNDTQIGAGVLGLDTAVGSSGALSFRFYGDGQSYDQNFSSVAANRNSESLTNQQHVPAQRVGGTAWYSQTIGRQTFGAGIEASELTGVSDENTFSGGRQTAVQTSGGHQGNFAVFGEDVVHLGARWTVTGSLRFDQVRYLDGEQSRMPVGPPPTVTTTLLFPDRTETAFSPRMSVVYALNKNVSLSAAAYHAFRAPTLNELYRSFRQGNTVTLANPGLVAERLTGGEAGASASTLNGKLTVRGNFFWNQIDNPIENVTIATTPTLITRVRENLGLTRSAGFDLAGVLRVTPNLQFSGAYQFVAANVVDFSANPALVGLRVPQVPQNQFTLEGRYWSAGYLLSVQGRFNGNQFDDDQNQFPLGRYFVVNAMAGRSLGHGMLLFAAFENLLNQTYNVALTPTPNIGPKFLVRGGLRYNFPGR